LNKNGVVFIQGGFEMRRPIDFVVRVCEFNSHTVSNERKSGRNLHNALFDVVAFIQIDQIKLVGVII